MRAMNHPNYKRTYWTPERRKAASDRAKRRWEERRASERAEYEKERQSAGGRLRQLRYSKASEMNEIAHRWHRLKAEVEEIDKGLALIGELRPILKKFAVQN